MRLSTTRQTLPLLMLAALFAASPATADVLMPVVRASIHDEPIDGTGDTFNAAPFEGLLRRVVDSNSNREDRAIAEFDLAGFGAVPLASAVLDFTLAVNNFGGAQTRLFDVFLYAGNGAADLSDFSIAGTAIGQVTLTTAGTPGSYRFDVLPTVQALLAGGSRFVGLRLHALGTQNFPTVLVDPTLTVVPVPEPTSIALAGLGLALLGAAGRRGRRTRPETSPA